MNAPPQSTWTRARSADQKRLRQAAILAAAGSLIDELGVEKVSLSAIARAAGLSKANCYRYFENREAILLELLVEEGRSWSEEVIEALDDLRVSAGIDQVTNVLVRATVERPRLCELTSALWTVLEQNVSLEVAADFKRRFHELSIGLRDRLSQRLPDLGLEGARQFITYYMMFTASAWAAAKPSPTMQALFELPEFQAMQMDFGDTLMRHSTLLLDGFLSPDRTQLDA